MQCLFFIEPDPTDPDDGTIRALCMECAKIQRPNNCWFYDGQVGPWDVVCFKCSQVIHKHEEGSDEATSCNEDSRR